MGGRGRITWSPPSKIGSPTSPHRQRGKRGGDGKGWHGTHLRRVRKCGFVRLVSPSLFSRSSWSARMAARCRRSRPANRHGKPRPYRTRQVTATGRMRPYDASRGSHRIDGSTVITDTPLRVVHANTWKEDLRTTAEETRRVCGVGVGGEDRRCKHCMGPMHREYRETEPNDSGHLLAATQPRKTRGSHSGRAYKSRGSTTR
jgi:hypothetical protein